MLQSCTGYNLKFLDIAAITLSCRKIKSALSFPGRYNLDNSVELFISNCFQSLQSKQNTDLNLNSRRRMLTVYMALIHILNKSPNRIKFPVPPFNSIFLCCSDPNACGLHDSDSTKLHRVFRCKIQVQELLS